MLLKKTVQNYRVEFVLTLMFACLLGYFYEIPKQTIQADGIGYYDYLPATVHYQDIKRNHQNYQSESNLYKRIDSIGREIYVTNDVYLVNKYPIGTAICMAPFFAITYSVYSILYDDFTCYEFPFQLTVWVSALVFVFLALIYLRKLLSTYAIAISVIRWLQVLLLIATPLTRYAHIESSMSHVYSLAVITATAYVARQFFSSPNRAGFLYACAGLAFIVLLRQVNGLVFLFLPFLAGSWASFSQGVQWLFKHIGVLFMGILLAVLLVAIQPLFWWLQTGKFIIYSYTNEQFYFSNPYFVQILFGFKKGLFVYTPVLLLLFCGIYYFIKTKQWYLLVSWALPFIIANYVLSSWWSWFYGCSFGLRAYIDFYPFFFILIALALTHLTYKFWLVLFGLITIPVNLIQTYQYREYILHWINMDWGGYKKVFLRTDKQFGGVLWKEEFNASDFDTISVLNLGTIHVNAENHYALKIPINHMKAIHDADMFQFSFYNSFNNSNKAELVFVITDTANTNTEFYANRRLLHFFSTEFNTQQKGWYNFPVSVKPDQNKLFIINYEQSATPEKLEQAKLLFFKSKKKLPK